MNLVTLMSILFGSLLGFIAFMLCRNGNPIANRITGFCVWLVQGMPAVVLLMILYYIVFQSFALTGTMVAIIGFTLVFGSGVFTDLMTAVGAIDRGQLEAAYMKTGTQIRLNASYPNKKSLKQFRFNVFVTEAE